MTDDDKSSWRNIASDLVDAGRALATIERMIRNIGATAAIDDQRAAVCLHEAYSAARKLVQALDNVRRRYP